MQVRAENIGHFCRDLRVRAALWLAVSIFVLIGSGFLIALTLVILFDPNWNSNAGPVQDPIATACCGLFAGVIPACSALAGIAFGVREVRRAHALEALLELFPNGATFELAPLAHKLGEGRARRAYVDAISRGGIFDSALAPSRYVPPQSLPSPQVPSQAPPAYGATPLHFPPAPPLPQGLGPQVYGQQMPILQPSITPQPATNPSVRPDPLAATTPSLFPSTQPTPAQAVPAQVLPPPAGAAAQAAGKAARPSPARAGESAGDITGRTLKGTWFVEKRLAAGGMGAVYAARHLRTGRNYAVKTMLPDERVSPEAIHRFEREAKAASAIGHAGIIAVHDFDRTEDGVHFIVMDLLEGETLEHRLARLGRLAWPDARRIALEVCEALSAAHRAGILHRDLKPSNVFMSQRPGRPERAVLVDFGLAKPIREGGSVWVTRTGAIVGTAHYMAPEQARGERVDERADVYGLGALIYEMIAGVPPFLGSTAFAVLTLLLTEQPVAPSGLVPGIPAQLDALVLRALAKMPADRPETVAAFATELAQIGDA